MALGSFPLAAGHYRSATASRALIRQVFGVWLGLVGASLPRAHPVALPPADIIGLRRSRGSTSIDFGENQLSPGLIGLSPLPTSHPSGFQPTPVRASTGCYPSFTLLMGRSPWLRVCPRVLLGGYTHALVTGLAFAPAPPATGLATHARSNSPDHNAKGTQSDATDGEPPAHPPTACRHVVSGSLSLPAQGCFSPVPHGTRPLSVTRESLALEGGPPSFTPDYSSRALLRIATSP